MNQVSAIAQEISKKIKEEKNKFEQTNININKKEEEKPKNKNPKYEMLKVEFEPPEIETYQFIKE